VVRVVVGLSCWLLSCCCVRDLFLLLQVRYRRVKRLTMTLRSHSTPSRSPYATFLRARLPYAAVAGIGRPVTPIASKRCDRFFPS